MQESMQKEIKMNVYSDCNKVLEIAEGLCRNRQFCEAIENLNSLIECKDLDQLNLALALNIRGNSFANLGKYERAYDDYSAVLNIRDLANDNCIVYALIGLGKIYAHENKTKKAIEIFGKALDMSDIWDAHRARALYERGVLYKATKKYTEALDDLYGVTKIDSSQTPLIGYAFVHIGQIFEIVNNKSANEMYAKALSMASDNDGLFYFAMSNHANFEAKNKLYDKAIIHYTDVIKRCVANKALELSEIYFRRGNIKFCMNIRGNMCGFSESSIEDDFGKAIESCGNNYAILGSSCLKRAIFRISNKKYKESIDDCNLILSTDALGYSYKIRARILKIVNYLCVKYKK